MGVIPQLFWQICFRENLQHWKLVQNAGSRAWPPSQVLPTPKFNWQAVFKYKYVTTDVIVDDWGGENYTHFFFLILTYRKVPGMYTTHYHLNSSIVYICLMHLLIILSLSACGILMCLHIYAGMLSHFSHVRVFGLATLWTVTHQAPLSVGFSRQEYRSGLSCPPPGESSQPRGRTCISYSLLLWQEGSLPLVPLRKPLVYISMCAYFFLNHLSEL